MPRPKVYVETSIPSFYCTTRTDPESVACKGWTQHWWDFKRGGYEVFASEIVVEELESGDHPTKADALSLIHGVPILAVESAISEIVRTSVRHFLMPVEPVGDAMHLMLGLFVPCLVTPIELLGENP